MKEIFEILVEGRDLSREQTRAVFDRIMAGELPEPTVGALLGAMRAKGESVEELVGAAEAMRAAVTPVACDADCMDTCGTGGDGHSTFNVSTTAAIVAAAAGGTVAKHGNRSTTRASGSTEVLDELGIDVAAGRETVERSLAEVGIGYLNARLLHPAMKYAAPVRKAIPVRTIFNLLGPLTNPAGARRHLLGVSRLALVDKMAEALLRLGAVRAWVVHGDDGLCDLTVTTSTTVVEIQDGCLKRHVVTPESVGLNRGSLDDLMVDSPTQSAAAIMAVLGGVKGAMRDHALLNAGAALVVAGRAAGLGEGVALAAQAIDAGRALDTLARWRAVCGKGNA